MTPATTMSPTSPSLAVRRLEAAEIAVERAALVDILCDCVDGGASVSFLAPMSRRAAEQYWDDIARDVGAGGRTLFAIADDLGLAGTVQLVPASVPNQPHRADISKLLVHRRARRRGLGRQLMLALEDEARRAERTLLTLDTRVGDAAEPLYASMGYRLAGIIPRYARASGGALDDTALYWKELNGAGPAPIPAASMVSTSADVEILGHEQMFRSYLTLDSYRLRHRLHGGGLSAPITRELLRRGQAVGVLLYDIDREAVALIEQFRIGALAAGFPAWMLEIVAGLVEPGETALDVAKREAYEEAGAALLATLPVTRYVVSPGCTDETVEIILARVDSRDLGGIHGLRHEGEDIRVVVMPLSDALAACDDGRIANSMTLLALQWLALNHAQVAARWHRMQAHQPSGEDI